MLYVEFFAEGPGFVKFGKYIVARLDSLHDHLRVSLHLDRGPCGYECCDLLPLASSADDRVAWVARAMGQQMQMDETQ